MIEQALLLLIKNMSIDLKSQQIALRNYILEDSAENEQAFNKAYEDYIALNEELKSSVSSSKMKDHLSRSDEAMSQYYELAQQIMTLRQDRGITVKSRLLKDTAPSLISEFEGIVEGMETHQQDAMNSGVVEAIFRLCRSLGGLQLLEWLLF